jgi:hypothetical protein
MGDYKRALLFYIAEMRAGLFTSIVFADNSASELAELKALSVLEGCANKVEFISFHGLDYPPEYARGYGEMRLVDHCMMNSVLIQAAAADEMIWKITGRYVIENIKELIGKSSGSDFYCHCRNYPRPWADMYLMGWTKSAYEPILRDAAEKIKEGIGTGSAEIKFRRLIDEKAGSHLIQRRFRTSPRINGVRGWDNKQYGAEKGKALVRGTFARLAPWIWI